MYNIPVQLSLQLMMSDMLIVLMVRCVYQMCPVVGLNCVMGTCGLEYAVTRGTTRVMLQLKLCVHH